MSKGWHPQDIIAAVRKRGSSLRALSLRNGFAQDTLYKALRQRFPNAHTVIADFLELSRHELWPEWYRRDDTPRFRQRADLHRSEAA